MKWHASIWLLSGFLTGTPMSASAEETPPDDPVVIHADWTQFLSAAVAGDGDRSPRYGGRVDGYAHVDGAKLGLWDGLSFSLQGEFVYGNNTNRIGSRLLLPVNAALSVPVNNDEAFDVSYSVIQKIGKVRIQAGKINLLDSAAAIPMVAGGGKDGFSHMGLAAPPGLLTTPKVLGAIVSAPVGGVVLNLGVWSPDNQARRYGIADSFKHGVNGWGAAVVPTRIAGLRGFHTLSLYVTSRRGRGAADYPDIDPPPGVSGLLPPRNGGTHIRYSVQQYLWQDPANPKRGWGLFGHIGASGGTPGILDWSMTAGIAGSMPAKARPQDRFGIGYFRFALARRVREGLRPVLPVGDEQGMEVYYTAQLGSRTALTAYGQVIDPAIENAATAGYLGLRVKTQF